MPPRSAERCGCFHPDRCTADGVTLDVALRVLARRCRFLPLPGTVDVRRARRRWAATGTLQVVQEGRSAAAAQKRDREIVTDPADVEAAVRGHAPSAEALSIGREILQELEEATTHDRWRAFDMHHAEGHTAAPPAAEMGARVNTVYAWVHEAANDLCAYLARRNARTIEGRGAATTSRRCD